MSQAAGPPAPCWSPFSGGFNVLQATDKLAVTEPPPARDGNPGGAIGASEKQLFAEPDVPQSLPAEQTASLATGAGAGASHTPPPSPPDAAAADAPKDAAVGLVGVRGVGGPGSRVERLRALEADAWHSWTRPGSPLANQVELASTMALTSTAAAAAAAHGADVLVKTAAQSHQVHALASSAGFASSSPPFGPSTAAPSSNVTLPGGSPAGAACWAPHREDDPLAAAGRPRSGSVDSSFLGRYQLYYMNQLHQNRGFAPDVSTAAALLSNSGILANGSVHLNGKVASVSGAFNGASPSAGCSCNCACAAFSSAPQTTELLVTPPSSPFSYFSSKAVFGDNDRHLGTGIATPPTPKRRLSAPCVFPAGGVAPRPELARHRFQQSTLFGVEEAGVAGDVGFAAAAASSFPGQSHAPAVRSFSGDTGSRQLFQYPEMYCPGLAQVSHAGEEAEDGLTEADRQHLVRDMFESYFSDRRIWGLIQNLSSRAISHSGWCSIAPVTTFSKVTRITTNLDTIINALRRSSVLQLSQDRTRVRRLDRPNLLSSIAAAKSWRNTVYMLGFPPVVRKAELFEYFSAFGRVSSITLCPSLTGAPTTVLAEFVTADMASRCILHGSHVFQGCQIEIVSRRTTKRHSCAGGALSGGALSGVSLSGVGGGGGSNGSGTTSTGGAAGGLSVNIPSSGFPPLGTPHGSPATAAASAMFHPGMPQAGFYQQH